MKFLLPNTPSNRQMQHSGETSKRSYEFPDVETVKKRTKTTKDLIKSKHHLKYYD